MPSNLQKRSSATNLLASLQQPANMHQHNNSVMNGGVLGGSLRAAGAGIFGVNNLHLGIRQSLRLSLLSAEQIQAAEYLAGTSYSDLSREYNG